MLSTCHHELGSQIIDTLLNGQRLTKEDYYQRFGFGIGHDLLERNVLVLHLSFIAISFQSQLIETYCEHAHEL